MPAGLRVPAASPIPSSVARPDIVRVHGVERTLGYMYTEREENRRSDLQQNEERICDH